MKIDPELHQRLMAGLSSAVGYFNDGDDPNLSVAKSAADEGFNPDQTRRLVCMFNTARTAHHFITEDEKTASFPLADPDEVLGIMWSGRLKPADDRASRAMYLDDSPYYTDPDRLETELFCGKAAGLDDEELSFTDKVVDDSLSETAQAAEEVRKHAVWQDLLEETKSMLYIAEDRMQEQAEALASKVASDLRGGDEAKIAKLATIVHGNGHKLSSAFGYVLNFIPPRLEVKRADLDGFVDDTDLGWYYDRLGEIDFFIQKFAEYTAAQGELLAQTERAGSPIREKFAAVESGYERVDALLEGIAFNPPAKTAAVPAPKDKDPKGKKAPVEQDLDSMTRALGKGYKDLASDALSALRSERQRELSGLTDDLKNMERSSVLQDLMLNDPIISEADPDEVASAYRSLLYFAPQASGNTEVSRAMIRQMLHSDGFSPYDASQLAELEKTHQQTLSKYRPSKDDDGAKDKD